MFSKLSIPASAKIRQLQKIVQDIKKNDNSFLNKIRRMKTKPVPQVPARDYGDDDQWSESEYDNDMYEDPREDREDSYEPPPTHRVFTTTPSASCPRQEYLDNFSNQPQQPPRKPLRPGIASKQLPPEPPHAASDEIDYTDSDHSPDDNYIEPAENPSSNYEVSDTEKDSFCLTASRLRPIAVSHSVPPKPSPRLNRRTSSIHTQEVTGEDEYEVCDPDDNTRDTREKRCPLLLPKLLPRDMSQKPPLRPVRVEALLLCISYYLALTVHMMLKSKDVVFLQRPKLKPKEFGSQTKPVKQKPPTGFLLDFMQPKIHHPQSASLRAADGGDVSAENELINQKDAELYNKSWYAGTCDRKTADDVLIRFNKDGAFLVRKSSGQDAQQPYTLAVFYNGRVYNVPVRYIPSTQQYALGRQKQGEEHFSSISHIIENHQRSPLVLIDSQSHSKDSTKLCYPVKP
ncbi:B-cell linker protein isoform X2 [Antennarius striatus]|uniref:B-cell linker protein isoform X2 n=1 Tax=Antennarius striatus TaxID=241820 RepID=UPI0035AE9D02